LIPRHNQAILYGQRQKDKQGFPRDGMAGRDVFAHPDTLKGTTLKVARQVGTRQERADGAALKILQHCQSPQSFLKC